MNDLQIKLSHSESSQVSFAVVENPQKFRYFSTNSKFIFSQSFFLFINIPLKYLGSLFGTLALKTTFTECQDSKNNSTICVTVQLYTTELDWKTMGNVYTRKTSHLCPKLVSDADWKVGTTKICNCEGIHQSGLSTHGRTWGHKAWI